MAKPSKDPFDDPTDTNHGKSIFDSFRDMQFHVLRRLDNINRAAAIRGVAGKCFEPGVLDFSRREYTTPGFS